MTESERAWFERYSELRAQFEPSMPGGVASSTSGARQLSNFLYLNLRLRLKKRSRGTKTVADTAHLPHPD